MTAVKVKSLLSNPTGKLLVGDNKVRDHGLITNVQR